MWDVLEAMWVFLSYVASFTVDINSVWMISFIEQPQIPPECSTHESCTVPARMTDGSISNQANLKNAALNLMQGSREM